MPCISQVRLKYPAHTEIIAISTGDNSPPPFADCVTDAQYPLAREAPTASIRKFRLPFFSISAPSRIKVYQGEKPAGYG